MNDEPSKAEPQGVAASNRRPRFGLLTLMLLITAIAVWMAYWQTQRDIARMQLALPGLRDAARQLTIDDPTQYAVVRKHELWSDDFRWDAYLPPGGRYVLRMATEQIDAAGLAAPVAEYPLDADRHRIQLFCEQDEDQWRVETTVDGRAALQDSQPLSWNAGEGSIGASEVEHSVQSDVAQPLVLFRRRFMVPTGSGRSSTPTGATAGILLWIERLPDVPSAAPTGDSPGAPK